MHPTDCLCAECRNVIGGPVPSQPATTPVTMRSGMDRHVECYCGPFDGARFRAEELDAYINMPAAMPSPYHKQGSFAEALARMEDGRQYKYVRVEVNGVPQRNAGGRVMYKLLGSDLGLGEK